jgi:hypothetical protein
MAMMGGVNARSPECVTDRRPIPRRTALRRNSWKRSITSVTTLGLPRLPISAVCSGRKHHEPKRPQLPNLRSADGDHYHQL